MAEVRGLYLRDLDMDVEEFERLFDVAVRGGRPEHPGLPAYLPLSVRPGPDPFETVRE